MNFYLNFYYLFYYYMNYSFFENFETFDNHNTSSLDVFYLNNDNTRPAGKTDIECSNSIFGRENTNTQGYVNQQPTINTNTDIESTNLYKSGEVNSYILKEIDIPKNGKVITKKLYKKEQMI